MSQPEHIPTKAASGVFGRPRFFSSCLARPRPRAARRAATWISKGPHEFKNTLKMWMHIQKECRLAADPLRLLGNCFHCSCSVLVSPGLCVMHRNVGQILRLVDHISCSNGYKQGRTCPRYPEIAKQDSKLLPSKSMLQKGKAQEDLGRDVWLCKGLPKGLPTWKPRQHWGLQEKIGKGYKKHCRAWLGPPVVGTPMRPKKETNDTKPGEFKLSKVQAPGYSFTLSADKCRVYLIGGYWWSNVQPTKKQYITLYFFCIYSLSLSHLRVCLWPPE